MIKNLINYLRTRDHFIIIPIEVISKIRIFTKMDHKKPIRKAVGGGVWRSEAGCGAGLGLKGFVFGGTVGWYGV